MNWVEGQLLHSGKYEIKRQIGGGGFGLTYLAEELLIIKKQIDSNVGLAYMAEELPIGTLQREVVIKTPNRTLQDDLEYEKFINRFQLEGQRLEKISHPNVVGVLDFFQEAGVPCLVMEYVAGETLSALVKRKGCLSEDEARVCFEKLAEVLQAVHDEGLIHCDVHPKNILLQHYFEPHPESDDPLKGKFVLKPVLIDFGSAKSLQPSTLTVTTTANDFYVPYEQLERQVDSNPQQDWDVYALAATLYFAVMGERPPSTRSRRGRDLLKSQIRKRKLNKGLSRAILRGMAMNPKSRPQSMQAWMELLTPQPPFPWFGLSWLMLAYALLGLPLGLYNTSAWVWAVACTVTCSVAWPRGIARMGSAGVSAVIGVMAGTVIGTVIGVMAGAVIGTVIGVIAEAGWAVYLGSSTPPGPLSGTGFLVWAMNTTVGGAMFGAMAGAATAGLGFFGLSLAGMPRDADGFAELTEVHFLVENDLERRYQPRVVFLILVCVAILGLTLGGGVGWWLKLNGVKLPF